MKPSQILTKAIELGYYAASGWRKRPKPGNGRSSYMCHALANMQEHGIITEADRCKMCNLINDKINGWGSLGCYLNDIGMRCDRKGRTKFYKKWIKKLKAKGK